MTSLRDPHVKIVEALGNGLVKILDDTRSKELWFFRTSRVEHTFCAKIGNIWWFFRTSRGEHTFCAKIGNIWSVITHICCFLALISPIFRFTTRNPKEPNFPDKR